MIESALDHLLCFTRLEACYLTTNSFLNQIGLSLSLIFVVRYENSHMIGIINRFANEDSEYSESPRHTTTRLEIYKVSNET